MLNRDLRLMDVDIILKMGFFLRSLHKNLETLHHQQQSIEIIGILFQGFCGQGLSMESFEKMKKTKEGLIVFQQLYFHSCDRQVSYIYAQSVALSNDLNSVGILFVTSIDPFRRCQKR
ncbi:unnamed protein product [Rotaria socialis]|uniref:Uncharacterized protein n=1 Tax=Rotaria socialis TaxID=392032 RepID=A0A820UIX3_9BILA|nr:unnamed protein product [Rotaria socialis]CAF4484794.1 unnamed protein product [Rotaria socialis]